MLDHNQTQCASELATLLVKNFTDSHTPVTDDNLNILIKIFNRYPPDTDDGREAFMKSAIRYVLLCIFLSRSSRWSISEGFVKSGAPLLHDALSSFLVQQKRYGDSQRHFVRGSDPKAFARMLVLFSQEGYPGEKDLYLARAVLQ